MGRHPTQPCGTHAAYVRHLRYGETCQECKDSERERAAMRRAAKREAEMTVDTSEIFNEETGEVSQIVRKGDAPIQVEVPMSFDPIDSAKWRLAKVRGAMAISSPRDMAALAKREEEIIALLNELTGAGEEKKDKEKETKEKEMSPLDQLAARRAKRLSAS